MDGGHIHVEYGDPRRKKRCSTVSRRSTNWTASRRPTMVQHGANDTNVPVIEAEQIAKTLRDRGVPVEYILFPDEGHGGGRFPIGFADGGDGEVF